MTCWAVSDPPSSQPERAGARAAPCCVLRVAFRAPLYKVPGCSAVTASSWERRNPSRLALVIMNRALVLKGKSCNGLNSKNGVTLRMDGVCTVCYMQIGQRLIQCCAAWGSQHLNRHNIVYTTLPSLIVLTLINSISNDTLQSLSDCLTGAINGSGPSGAKHLVQSAGPNKKCFSGERTVRKR